MDDHTDEILNILRNGLSGKNSLFFAPVDSFVERLVYIYVKDILRNDPDRGIVWLCLSSSRDKILAKFRDFGYDVSEFSDNLAP